MKRTVSVFLFAACTALTGACSSAAEPASSGPADADQIPVSTATKQTFGVDHWSRQESPGDTVIAGTDPSGTVRVRFEQVITTDGAGVTHGVLTTDIDGATTTMQYAIGADGQGRVEKNEFPTGPRAVEAARDALADFQMSPSQGSLVSTKSLAPLDLVKAGSPLLEGGKCLPSLIAAVCIVASLCGLGGSSGAEVLAGAVEAGTEQCE